jgi:hypothetical protein
MVVSVTGLENYYTMNDIYYTNNDTNIWSYMRLSFNHLASPFILDSIHWSTLFRFLFVPTLFSFQPSLLNGTYRSTQLHMSTFEYWYRTETDTDATSKNNFVTFPSIATQPLSLLVLALAAVIINVVCIVYTQRVVTSRRVPSHSIAFRHVIVNHVNNNEKAQGSIVKRNTPSCYYVWSSRENRLHYHRITFSTEVNYQQVSVLSSDKQACIRHYISYQICHQDGVVWCW